VTLPEEIAGMRRALGQELARLRHAAGLSQRQFAPLTSYSRSTLSDAELGRGRVSRDFWERCEIILRAGDALTRLYDETETVTAAYQSAAVQAAARGPLGEPPAPSRVTLQICPVCHQAVKVILLPPGR
jgi:transcriptional regulator with XRE-family HTH domain